MSNILKALSLRLDPVRSIAGNINLPGSKSISNRALILSALAKGETKISNLLDADDVAYMLSSLRQLNIEYHLSEDRTSCCIKGKGGSFSSDVPTTLHLGNAGTAMRPLCAVLTLGVGEFILTGDTRMQERPIGHLVEALQEAGASIEYLNNIGFPPIKIIANQLRGGKIFVKADVSSQFLTALLIALPLASTDSIVSIDGVLVSKPYIEMTLHMIKQFGIHIENKNDQQFFIPGKQCYLSPGKFLVEGDASTASYFLAAAAIRGKINVYGLSRKSIQGDVQFVDVLEKMGAQVRFEKEMITVEAEKLHGIDGDFNHIPDAAMTIAVLALFAKGKTVLRNIGNWRVKETDRLHAMATELRKVGAVVEEGTDYLSILPPAEMKHTIIDTYNDHRMAMCFSLLALSDQGITINNPGCVSKTFPNFFEDFASISVSI